MHRFFIREKVGPKHDIKISGSDYNHIVNVLRLSEGCIVNICDEDSVEYTAEIKQITKDSVILNVKGNFDNSNEPECKVTLYQGMPKSSKMDLIIQKCVELGINRIVPVFSRRCVVNINNEIDRLKKQTRWMKISEEAAKQSRRGIIPYIETPVDFDIFVQRIRQHQLFMIPWEDESTLSIKSVLQRNSNLKDIGFFIGPEGGIAADEISVMKDQGAVPVTLGKRILRTETAGFAVLTIILYQMNEMG